jgi:hypothetical protein
MSEIGTPELRAVNAAGALLRAQKGRVRHVAECVAEFFVTRGVPMTLVADVFDGVSQSLRRAHEQAKLAERKRRRGVQ